MAVFPGWVVVNLVLTGALLFLAGNLAAGMLRVYRGPTAADRMLAALLFGSTTVAMLLLLAEVLRIDALRDVALLFVMLAAIISVAFTGLREADDEEDESSAGAGDHEPAEEGSRPRAADAEHDGEAEGAAK